LKCGECAPPPVLKPRFESSRTGWRALKRWIRKPGEAYSVPREDPALDALGASIADRPGSANAADTVQALSFADSFRNDFDEVFVLECSGRSLTALAGELAARMGLRLEGHLRHNLARLRDFCSARRFLLVLANAAPSKLSAFRFGGQCSLLAAAGPGVEPSADPLEPIQRALSEAGPAADWSGLCTLVRQGRRLAQEQGRFAECYELMEQWSAEAETRGDRAIQDESAREMMWTLESWGRLEEAQRLEFRRIADFGEQMVLQF
jgi:hypothetical protein